SLRTDFSDPLGPTDPCSTAVHMEPFSSFSPQGSPLEYLLLPPRSAPVCGSRRAHARHPSTHATATLLLTAAEFRLPWPSSDCLEQPTPFMGSHERLASDALTGRLVHPTAPVLLTKSGPLGTLILSRPPSVMQGGLLTHLKFENRLRSFRPQGL
ncbi:hypothetical protein JTE90_008919, partial [Oedothorax gibbosus]